jgi:hypothetical protein
MVSEGGGKPASATCSSTPGLRGVIFGGLHRLSWYHPHLEVSRNAPFSTGQARSLLGLGLAALCVVLGAQAAAEGITSGSSGASRAKVVTVYNPEAISAFLPRPDVVRDMVTRGVTNITHKTSLKEAWLSLLSKSDVVGIKVYSLPGANSGTRPAVVTAVIEGLLSAGLPPKNIIIWDKQATDLRLAGYFDLAEKYGVRAAGSAQAGYETTNAYESAILGSLVWGDVEFGRKGFGVGRKSFVSKLVSDEITKIINISPLLNHNLAGVSGNLYSLAIGSVDNVSRFEGDPARLAVAVPEIYALPSLSDRVVLSIVDALICQYEGGERGRLHSSSTLNELWFSKDPVALDVLALQEVDRQRGMPRVQSTRENMDLYNNAALLELGVSDPNRITVERVQ